MRAIVFGSRGMLGSELVRQLQAQGEQVFALDSAECDVTDAAAVGHKVSEVKPEVIFNCVAYNAVDKAESEPEKAYAINAEAVKNIATAAQAAGATLVNYSTGFIFDGNNPSGYKEDDQTNPQSVYAKSKLQGEQESAKCSKHYIIRLNMLFGKPGQSANSKKSFPELILDLAKTKNEFDFVTDETSTPTSAKDLAEASIKLVKENYPYGIYHLPNDGSANWLEYAQEVFRLKNMPEIKLNPVSSDKFVRPAQRPKNSVIINTKFPKLRTWQEALKEFLSEERA